MKWVQRISCNKTTEVLLKLQSVGGLKDFMYVCCTLSFLCSVQAVVCHEEYGMLV